MSTQASFIKLEKEFLPQFRDKINSSEDIADVQNCFSHTVKTMLQKAFEKQSITFFDENISMTATEPYYTIKHTDDAIKPVWGTSDLKDIIKRFARIAYKRILYLQKNPSKTQKKIRR